MRKPEIDYRQLRLHNISEPRFRHLFFLIVWPFYIALFFVTEYIYPIEQCHIVYCALDDKLPFLEFFVIPYVGWYFVLALTVFYFVFYDVKVFRQFHIYLIIVAAISLGTYCIYPTRVAFQPETFPRDNVLTDLVKLLYAADQSSNACPSLHVGLSLAVASAWSKSKAVRSWVKVIMWAVAISICLSTMFIKQHSALDVFWALPVCAAAEMIVFGKSYWLPKLRKTAQNT